MRAFTIWLGCFGMTMAVAALPPPFDEAADPHAELQRALTLADSEHKNVLIIFGANWCEDCRDLEAAMQGPNAALIHARFVLVKVDVGNFNRNLDIARRYGDPIRTGIPAAVVLSPRNQVLYATRAGELANARRLGSEGVYRFLASLPAG